MRSQNARALTETPMSAAPAMHPARAMGAREGTGPEDNPLMRSHGARARMKGHAQGHRRL